jgi:2-succinyl-5-enolpyruvyl-6-hydroxy-3-cyclohexene-1-carboxylate synthase
MTAPNPATRLARLAVRSLTAAGVRHVVLCPGSRSAPLAYALAGAVGPDLTLHVRHDERVAAFTALGIGLGGRTIGAVVTTSGTAAANLHPAVLEAHHANRPVVVVTADRPPALRGTWANQTSDLQSAVFGDAVRAQVDLDDASVGDATAASDRLARAVLAAQGFPTVTGVPTARPGPVHLNLGFADPLVPDPDDDGDGGGAVRGPALLPAAGATPSPSVALRLAPGPRTVVLAGDGAGPQARAFAEAAGLPLLAEPSSGARRGPNAIGPYRLLLELDAFGGAVERVVAFGRPTLSRPVTRLVGRADVDVVLVSPFADWPDPGRPVTRCAAVAGDPPADDGRELARWRAAGDAATAALEAVLDDDLRRGVLSGPSLAREVWSATGPGDDLVSGSSNPIRDLDLAARPGSPADGAGSGRVFANRGLAGIDGTIATATGLALVSGRPTRLLLGDVTFLHDVGALLAGPAESRPDLQVVVLNDDGGGIFGLLEYGALADAGPEAAALFERLFGTPHGADLGALCRGYGVRHDLVKDVDTLRAALATPGSGTSVLEVRAERSALRALHARLRSAVHEAARAP